jgi:DNA-binding response OmpR family regulator
METTQPAVLIVDDDRGTCETVDWALRPAGVHVEMAASGAEGLALARSLQFELLLIDLCLPDMLGTALIRTLVGERRSVPFVLLSGFLTTEVTVEAMKLGASDVFEKPVAIETLCETVDAVIARRPPGSHDNGTASGSCPMSAAVAGMRPRSAAERWAVHVLKGFEADGDLNTLRNWPSAPA